MWLSHFTKSQTHNVSFFPVHHFFSGASILLSALFNDIHCHSTHILNGLLKSKYLPWPANEILLTLFDCRLKDQEKPHTFGLMNFDITMETLYVEYSLVWYGGNICFNFRKFNGSEQTKMNGPLVSEMIAGNRWFHLMAFTVRNPREVSVFRVDENE